VEERTAELAIANEELHRQIEEHQRIEAALRQSRDALRESEEKYKSLVEASPDAVIMADLTGHATFVSRQFVELHLAENADEFLGKCALDFMVPEEHEKCGTYYRKTLENGITRDVEYSFFKKDGTRFPAELSSALVRDAVGKPVGIVSVLRDISERKAADQALRQSERRFRSYFEQGLLGMAISDGEMRWTEVNDHFCDILGYSKEEVLQRKISDFVHPDDLEAFHRSYQRLISGGSDHYTVDRRYLRKDGKVVYLNIFVKVFRSADGNLDHFLALLDDVTDRRQAEEALKREHRTLKYLLQSSDHERQTIAYEIHDGLAQYLAGAIMQFDVYKHQQEKKPNEAARAYEAAVTLLRQGHGEARRLIAGIRHPVLDEAGVVEAVAHLINEQNREKGPKIEFRSVVDFSRLVPLLENAIYRILQEGMTNACKHSESSRVRVSLLQQKDHLRIEIRDWGIGFDVKHVKEGSYGLAGIRERARLLGGEFHLRSAAGKGTRIVVELPLLEREE
jgi:PAS domain S-box-containing protein